MAGTLLLVLSPVACAKPSATPSAATRTSTPIAIVRELPGIRGQLRDGLGNALADCEVWLEATLTAVRTTTDVRPVLLQTDTAGRFAAPLPAGTYAVSAHPRDLPPVMAGEGITVERTMVDLGAIALPDAPGIKVEVRDQGGSGLSGATLAVAPVLERWELPLHARAVYRRRLQTDAVGSGRLRALPPGRYILQAEADAHLEATTGFVVDPALPSPTLTMALASAFELPGVLQTATGDPLPGLAVAFEPCGGGPATSCRSDGAGTFRARLAPEPHRLRLTVPDGSQFVLEFVVPGAGPLRIVLPSATETHGQVTDRSRRQLSRAQVRLLPTIPLYLGQRLRLRCVEVVADHDGWFHCSLLPPGSYRAGVASDGGGQTLGPFDLPAATMNLTVEPPARLAGRVLDDRGLPLIGEPVTCVPLDYGDDALVPWLAAPTPAGTTDALGHFEFADLAAGEHVVRCTSSRLGPIASDPIRVAKGGVVRLPDLRAPGSAFLSGRVLQEGHPVPGATVVGRSRVPGGGHATATTDANGDFRLGPLGAGTVDLVYAAPSRAGESLPRGHARTAITLHAGTEAKADLMLP